MKIDIFLTNEQDKIAPPADIEQIIEQCTAAALAEEEISDDAEVSVTFVDNREIRALNSDHRGIDRETDVLSFPLGDRDNGFEKNYGTGAIVLGDIVISLERAAAQAEEYGHSFRREVAFLIAHSLFHLLGYDHVNGESEEKIMFSKQEKILEQIGIPRGEAK